MSEKHEIVGGLMGIVGAGTKGDTRWSVWLDAMDQLGIASFFSSRNTRLTAVPLAVVTLLISCAMDCVGV